MSKDNNYLHYYQLSKTSNSCKIAPKTTKGQNLLRNRIRFRMRTRGVYFCFSLKFSSKFSLEWALRIKFLQVG